MTTPTLYKRDGTISTRTVRGFNEKKGRGVVTEVPRCGRCGGAGGSPYWRPDGGVCYQCHGEGTMDAREVPVYTIERLTVLRAAADVKREAKAAKKAAAKNKAFEDFKADNPTLVAALGELASENSILADMLSKIGIYGSLTEKQIAFAMKLITETREKIANAPAEAARKEAAPYLDGEVGDRIEIAGKIERIIHGEGGYMGNGWTLTSIRTTDGAAVKYWGSLSHIVDSNYVYPVEGDDVFFRATIKEFDTYQGEKQTKVARPHMLS